MSAEWDGWHYTGQPGDGDARKFVTLEKDGMAWTGIRAWHAERKIWLNNGEPELARVIAWRDLPEIAHGRYFHGKLILRAPPAGGEQA